MMRLAAALLCCAANAGFAQTPQIIARGLENPWAVAFLDPQTALVTERPGRLRTVSLEGKIGPAIQGLPKISSGGQGGLLDLVLDAKFASNRTLYFCYTEADEANPRANSTALARARLNADASSLTELKLIFSQKPKVESRLHFGCRIVEAADNTLFLVLGDRYSRSQDAQTLTTHHGKIVRITKDGAVPFI